MLVLKFFFLKIPVMTFRDKGQGCLSMGCDSSQEGTIYKQIFLKCVNFLQSAKKNEKYSDILIFLQILGQIIPKTNYY